MPLWGIKAMPPSMKAAFYINAAYSFYADKKLGICHIANEKTASHFGRYFRHHTHPTSR